MYSLDSFLKETANALMDPQYEELRHGQLYMNPLWDRRNDLYHSISGTDIDPFNDDKRITKFWSFLRDNW